MRRWVKGFFVSGKQKANRAIDEASAKVGEIEIDIEHEIHKLEEECDLHRRLLKGLVGRNAARTEIMEATNRVNMLLRQIDMKRNLLRNMHRERRQLAAASMNTSVASVMKESLDAQKMLSMATCTNESIDDVLDDVEDCRQETDDLSERLGTTEQDESVDDTAFDMEQVRLALGIDTPDPNQQSMHELHILARSIPDRETQRSLIPLPPPIWPHNLPSVPQPQESTNLPEHSSWNF